MTGKHHRRDAHKELAIDDHDLIVIKLTGRMVQGCNRWNIIPVGGCNNEPPLYHRAIGPVELGEGGIGRSSGSLRCDRKLTAVILRKSMIKV